MISEFIRKRGSMNNKIKIDNIAEIKQMLQNALSFYLGAKRCMEVKILPNGGIQVLLPPYLVNLSFSCEVFIKILLKIYDVECKKEHNIEKLFCKLPTQMQRQITNYLNKYENFEIELKNIGDIFTKMRYYHEKGELLYNMGFLNSLTDILKNECELICKEFIDLEKL